MPQGHEHSLATLVTYYDHDGASDDKLWCEQCGRTIWFDNIDPQHSGE